MKKLLLLFLVCISVNAFSANWKKVSDNQNELMMQSVLKKFMDIEFRFHIVGEDIVLIRNDCDLSCHSVYGLEN